MALLLSSFLFALLNSVELFPQIRGTPQRQFSQNLTLCLMSLLLIRIRMPRPGKAVGERSPLRLPAHLSERDIGLVLARDGNGGNSSLSSVVVGGVKLSGNRAAAVCLARDCPSSFPSEVKW